MLSGVDPVGKIQQIYLAGERQVPYVTFMTVLNALLADAVKMTPREPSDQLRETFRAACMAVRAGVQDPEGRGEQRIGEFMRNVVPVWKAALPSAEWAKCDEILAGRGKGKAAPQGPAAASEPPPAAPVTPAAGASSDLLRRLGIVGGPAAQPPAAQEKPEPAPAPRAAARLQPATAPKPLRPVRPAVSEAPTEVEDGRPAPGAGIADAPTEVKEEGARVCESVDALVSGVRAGERALTFTTREANRECARYLLGTREVSLKLARAEGRVYAVLTVDVGHEDIPDAEATLDGYAAQMRYVRMADFAYMRTDGDTVYTIKVGADTLNMACGFPTGGAEAEQRTILLQIQRLHRDLGELLERLAAASRVRRVRR